MSFILDALRRAESRRGTQPAAVMTDSTLGNVAEKSSSLLTPRWAALLVAVAIAVAVFTINALGPGKTVTPGYADNPKQPTTNPTQPTTFSTIAPDTPLGNVINPGEREVRPLAREARVSSAPENDPAAAGPSQPGAVRPGSVTVSQQPLSATETPARILTNVPDGNTSVPSYQETVLNGRGQVPEFHLDIHVYASAPDRRFVFVNNRKYREGEQLDEGGTVERITPGGVILNHRGRRFELVPE